MNICSIPGKAFPKIQIVNILTVNQAQIITSFLYHNLIEGSIYFESVYVHKQNQL